MLGMPMCGMRMPGQDWPAAALSFLGMWVVMMAAMMTPSLLPMLARYRAVVAPSGPARLGCLTGFVSAGYFAVWTLVGAVAFPLGAVLATIAMDRPAVALVIVASGVLQFTGWKARHLACCRPEARCRDAIPGDLGTAWRHGVRLGGHCVACCAGPTAVLLASGAMDLPTMAAVTIAITLERLAPAGVAVARAIGGVAIGAGLVQGWNAWL